MSEAGNRELYIALRRNLSERSLLRRLGLTKKVMLAYLEESGLEQLAADLERSILAQPGEDPQTPVSVPKVLETCTPLLESLQRLGPFACSSSVSELPDRIFRRSLLLMYPDVGAQPVTEEGRGLELVFCEILHTVLVAYMVRYGHNPTFDFEMLSEEEAAGFPAGSEYLRMRNLIRKQYVYEFLVIAASVQPFNTLGHIAGVHHVAMHMARQLQEKNVPVDLAMTSAASMAHDIGKFGCKSYELSRLPHLHYYYTDDLLSRAGLPEIAHIASNHSTWDLELEDLSCENLLLIYADFRVKSRRDEQGREEICFYSLKQSFDVILSMLENVDEAKHDRYVRVYEKLKDFEDYMTSLGVDPDLAGKAGDPDEIWEDVSLLDSRQSVQRLKYLAIAHNIEVMHRFGGINEFGDLLEEARSERQWENIRAYINTLEEYFTYLTAEQKQMAIRFLRELLVQRGGDTRRRAAALIGRIIASYDEKYRKELPEGTTLAAGVISSVDLWEEHLRIVTEQDLHRTERQQRWIGYSLKITMNALFEAAEPRERKVYLEQLLDLLHTRGRSDAMAFILLDTLLEVPIPLLSAEDAGEIINYCELCVKRHSQEVRIALLRLVRKLAESSMRDLLPDCSLRLQGILDKIAGDDHQICVSYLRDKTLTALGLPPEEENHLPDRVQQPEGTGASVFSAMFRENLKVETPWVIRAVNIEIMLDGLHHEQRGEVFYVATHLSNLLKVSERTTIRRAAGRSLIEIFDLLSPEQQHEVVVELMKVLEIGDDQFSKYIPEYLGVLIMHLHPDELGEVLQTMKQLVQSNNDKVAGVALDTLGIVLQNDVYDDADQAGRQRRESIIGMLLLGMSNYREIVSQEAFQVLGQAVFGTDRISLDGKEKIFRVLKKKMLTLIEDRRDKHLRFFNNAASLNHIYRFISDYQFFRGELRLEEIRKAAFFPGTFDPFSLGHKGIVEEIRRNGFEVYLALDEFSWSKSTEARMHRRKIMTMSCADVTHAYIFPDDQPINIANPEDIRRLKKLLSGKDVYIVVGSDVIAGASSYRKDPEPDSIHSLNHIIFRRESAEQASEGSQDYEAGRSKITGDIVELTLPTHLEDISSTRIRSNIDENRDISNLIDPVVQSFIYDNALYMRQPMYKRIVEAGELDFHTELTDGTLRAVTVRSGGPDGKIVGEIRMQPAESGHLYETFGDRSLAAFVRERAAGRTLIIGEVTVNDGLIEEDAYQLILTEALAAALREDYTYAVYQTGRSGGLSPKQEERFLDTLRRQGFRELRVDGKETGWFGVDMRSPVSLLQNMSTVIKSPLNRNPQVEAVLQRAHERLQLSLTELFPDTLILSCSSAVMHHKLIRRIARENGVPAREGKKRTLGPHMCVPFGKILNNMAVPNTVTKTLHLEKSFCPDLSEFTIREYPNYALIEDQVRTIRSFRREVILVDDILHKGYRIQHLDPVLNENGIKVRELVAGILSGRGRDLMAMQGREVDYVYFISNLKAWFVESSQYPFIGGDGVERHTGTIDDDMTAINLILPYVLPTFLSKRCSKSAIYDFSMVCLENARDILKVLEEEYQKEFQRKLTLRRLPEAINAPKLTDVGQCLDFDRALAASTYVEDDIERLQRLKGLL